MTDVKSNGAREITWSPVDLLVPYARNARVHSAEQVARIAGSIARFGFNAPVLVDAKGSIIAGHGRVLAAARLGMHTVPVVRLEHVTERQAAEYRLADNRLAELATWDERALAAELAEIAKDATIDPETLGWSVEDLRAIAIVETAAAAKSEAAPPVPKDPISRAGDLWHLGEHRILCGDSTNAEDVARLMAGEHATLLATDPPYLVDYDGGNHPQNWAKGKKDRGFQGEKEKRWDDYREGGEALFERFMATCLPHCAPDVAVYQWHASSRVTFVVEAWAKLGLEPNAMLFWIKSRAVLTRLHMMQRTEPCLYGWRAGHEPPKDRRPPAEASDTWVIDQKGESDGIHPTQKPVEIFLRPMEWHMREGEIALEPFSGSGTSIMAAERARRRCRAMEISPAFVDVAIVRWAEQGGGGADARG